jgi:hypothetical protein
MKALSTDDGICGRILYGDRLRRAFDSAGRGRILGQEGSHRMDRFHRENLSTGQQKGSCEFPGARTGLNDQLAGSEPQLSAQPGLEGIRVLRAAAYIAGSALRKATLSRFVYLV